jgi:hypothetical protein
MSSYAYNPGTTAGTLYNQGIKNLVDFGNKYQGNETISNMVAGTLADSFATQANTGSALAYNNAFLGSMANYQHGIENLKTGNQMKLMAAEGQIQSGMIDQQGGWQIKGIQETGDQNRQGIRVQGGEDRLNLQTAGSEERKNITQRQTEELRARADARGAVRTEGARFFG